MRACVGQAKWLINPRVCATSAALVKHFNHKAASWYAKRSVGGNNAKVELHKNAWADKNKEKHTWKLKRILWKPSWHPSPSS